MSIKFIKNWFLLGLLLFIMLAFFYTDLNQYLRLEVIKQYQLSLQTWTVLHYKTAISIYIIIFTTLIACTIPCGTALTILGGFLFGMIAVCYAIISTTLGGMILFFAVRTSIGAHIAAKSSGWIKKMEKGFQQNAFRYLLMLRLIPVCPCWVSNVAAGALNVPLKTFIHATVLGILPATIIYVLIGSQLDHVLLKHTLDFFSTIRLPS